MPEAPPTSPKRVAGWLLFLIIVLHLSITSFNYIIVRPGLTQFANGGPPLHTYGAIPLGQAVFETLQRALPFAIWRFLLSSLALWIVLGLKGYRPVRRSDWRLILWLAILAIPLNQLPYLIGIGLVPPEHGALIYATTPVWVLIVARLLLGEKITPLKLLGIALAFFGVWRVFTEKQVTFDNTLLGDGILVFGVLGWAVYSVQGKVLTERYGALQTTTLAISLGSLLFLPVLPWAMLQPHYSQISSLGWISLLYMAFLTSAVAYTIWYWLMGQMETAKAAVLQNLQPVFTMLFTAMVVALGAAPLFNIQEHQITPYFLGAAAMTLAGVFITQFG